MENSTTEVMVTDLITVHLIAKNCDSNPTLLLEDESGRMKV